MKPSWRICRCSLPVFLLAWTLSTSCAGNRRELRREPFGPETLDGVHVFAMDSLKDEQAFAGSWRPPAREKGRFSRKLLAPGGTIAFYMPRREDAVVHLQMAGEGGLQVRMGDRSWPVFRHEGIVVLPAGCISAGDNRLELLPVDGLVQVQLLEIFPKRLLPLPGFKALRSDPRNFFLPGKLAYALKPVAGEELWLQLSWKRGKTLALQASLHGERSRRRHRLTIENGKPFRAPLLANEHQRLFLETVANKQGVLRLDASELRRPLARPPAADQKRLAEVKNVLLIVIDAARPDKLGIFGNQRRITPNIDRLARGGLSFANANCEAAYTVASTATLLTGLPAEFHGVTYSFHHALSDNFVTLAQMFAKKGFFTAAASANSNFARLFHYNRGFSRFDELFDRQAADLIAPFTSYLAEAEQRQKRFFIYLHLLEPHMSRRLVPPPFLGRFQSQLRQDGPGALERLWAIYLNKGNGPQDFAFFADCYDERLSYADDVVGRLLEILRARKMSADTMVVVLSDHGEGLGEHALVGHNVVAYEEAIKIVQVMHIPGMTPRIETRPLLTSDLPQTLCEAFALENPFRSDSAGENFLALPAERRRLTRLLKTRRGYPGFVIEQYPYKLAVYFPWDSGRIELYDLARDRGEKRNLYKPGSLPARSLLFYLRSHLDRARTIPRRMRPPAMSKKDKKNLETLGYINE